MEKLVGGRVQNLTNVEMNHIQVLDQEMLESLAVSSFSKLLQKKSVQMTVVIWRI